MHIICIYSPFNIYNGYNMYGYMYSGYKRREKETRSRIVYGASHRAGQLGETGPLQPYKYTEKETLKGGLRC
jgi:hypothetical protein